MSFREPSQADFKQNRHFASVIAWAQNFCEWAVQVLKAKDCEQQAETLGKRQQSIRVELETIREFEKI